MTNNFHCEWAIVAVQTMASTDETFSHGVAPIALVIEQVMIAYAASKVARVYDMHRYQLYNICEPLSDLAVSTAGRESTRSPHVHYCYSSALQNGGEYAEIIYFLVQYIELHPHRHNCQLSHNLYVVHPRYVAVLQPSVFGTYVSVKAIAFNNVICTSLSMKMCMGGLINAVGYSLSYAVG